MVSVDTKIFLSLEATTLICVIFTLDLWFNICRDGLVPRALEFQCFPPLRLGETLRFSETKLCLIYIYIFFFLGGGEAKKKKERK